MTPEGAKFLIEKIEREGREDLANGVVRVDNSCSQCPFSRWVHPYEPEKCSGNPKLECRHPATDFEDPPRVIKIGQWGHVPNNCPLREKEMRVVMVNPDGQWRVPGEDYDGS